MTIHELAKALKALEHSAFIKLVTLTPGEREDWYRLGSLTDEKMIKKMFRDHSINEIEKIARSCGGLSEFFSKL